MAALSTQSRGVARRALGRRALLLAGLGAATPARATEGPRGFRRARFGMTEQQLRDAVRRDFPGARLSRRVHPQERTTILATSLDGLLPDAGRAEVAYILGHSSRRLVQINLVWLGDGRDAVRDAALVAGANHLRDRLSADHATARDVVVNHRLPDETILVFRGAYEDGRMILLVLGGRPAAPRGPRPATPLALRLSYILDHRAPDTFRLPAGQF